MRRGIWGVVLWAAVVVGCSALPATSVARQREFDVSLHGKATNGYRWSLIAGNGSGGRGFVGIELDQGSASALYIDKHPRRVNRRRISARFGALGKVSLRFHSRRKREVDVRCFHATDRFGRFRGAVRFNGEAGYTTVRAKRPAGSVTVFSLGRGCGGIQSRSRDESSVLASCRHGKSVIAAEPAPGERAQFVASLFEEDRDLLTLRSLGLDGPARSMHVGRDRRSASLRPPPPFVGRATYADGQLTGNLRALLPGGGLTSFTPAPALLEKIGKVDLTDCFPYGFLLRARSTAALSLARTFGWPLPPPLPTAEPGP